MINPAAKNLATFLNKPLQAQIFLCLAVVLTYANIWPNGFLFNDGILITSNAFLRQWSTLPQLLTHLSNAGYGLPGGFYRPVEMLIYFVLYQAFGASTIVYHMLNLALHVLNACLLYHFGQRIGFKKGAVLVAALLWALHPLHTSNVAYMSSTAELLWTTFCFGGLITLLPDFTPKKIWQAMGFFILALGCKESAVIFPALATLVFFLTNKGQLKISGIVKTWPLWVLAVGYTAGWLFFMHSANYSIQDVGDPAYVSSFVNRTLTCLAALPVYARLIIWPTGLHIEWIFPTVTTLLAWQPLTGASLVALSLLHIFTRHIPRRGLALSFGLLWFAIALAPYTGIITPVDAVISEGWMYVPLMGLFLGTSQTVSGLFEKKQQLTQTLVCVLALALGIATFNQEKTWRTTESLYLNNAQNQNWDHAKRCYVVGLFYMQLSDYDKAIAQLQEVLDSPAGLDNNQLASTHMWIAMAWLHIDMHKDYNITPETLAEALPKSQHMPQAITELGKALQVDPDFYQVHKILAEIYRYQGNSQMAAFHDKKAAETMKGHTP